MYTDIIGEECYEDGARDSLNTSNWFLSKSVSNAAIFKIVFVFTASSSSPKLN